MVFGGLGAVVRSKAVREGLIGGRRGWLAVGIVVYGWKVLRWLTARRPEVIAVERIEPGQTIQITTLAAPTRHERRAARRG